MLSEQHVAPLLKGFLHLITVEDGLVSRTVVSDSVTPQTVSLPGFIYMGFPRQETWSRLPFPSLGDFPNPEIKPVSPAL